MPQMANEKASRNTSGQERKKAAPGDVDRQSGRPSVNWEPLSSAALRVRDYLGNKLPERWMRLTAAALALVLAGSAVLGVVFRSHTGVQTEVAHITSYAETIDTTGVSVRDEMVLSVSQNKGYAVKAVDDGEKVSQGQPLFNVFRSEEMAAAYTRLKEIDREIDELKSMATAADGNPDTVKNIEKVVDRQMMTLNENVCRSDLHDVAKLRNDITYLLNKRLIAMRKVEDYQNRIQALEAEKASLSRSSPQTLSSVESPAAGYYNDACDGFEEVLTPSVLEGLTNSRLQKLLSQRQDTSGSTGRLIQSFVWYLVCPVPKDKAEDCLSVGSPYTLLLPYSATGSMEATLQSLNEEENSDTVLAVFRCSSLVSELCHIRQQPVSIRIHAYRGFEIKRSALHVEIREKEVRDENHLVIGHQAERVPIVYVVVAGQLFSRRVDIVYAGKDTVICRQHTGESGYLAMYDEVVTEGENLYEQKIIG